MTSEMRRVGIAGYMGSGKTLVASILSRQEGTFIIDADAVAKQLMNSNAVIQKELAAAFGGDVIKEKTVVFSLLACRAFRSQEDLVRLNRIVHPLLLLELKRRVHEHGGRGTILDAALISFWGIEEWFDALCWVEADFETRFKRLSRKLALHPDAIRGRMRLQENLFGRPEGSRWIAVNNNGTIAELERLMASEECAPLRQIISERGKTI